MERMTRRQKDIVILGAGPVGLLLANLLGEQGREVTVIDAADGITARSMAIGITPPSLAVLQRIGLADAFVRRGVPIREAYVHEAGRLCGVLRLADARDDFPFILSLPQSETMALLRERLTRQPSVQLHTHTSATGLQWRADGVSLRVVAADAAEEELHANWLVACDGARGMCADWLGIARPSRAYAPHFLMGDFVDQTQLRDEAHLFFGAERPIESFPLSQGRRRWIIRQGWGDRIDLREPLSVAVSRLTGLRVAQSDQLDESAFQPRRALAQRFYRGRVVLCGDAAHVMSPIGGQGMNTGFADAVFLALALDGIRRQPETEAAWLAAYQRCRRYAFRRAARRAAMGMRLGVAAGAWSSILRRWLVSSLLGRPSVHAFLCRWFMMRSLPDPRQQVVGAASRIGMESVLFDHMGALPVLTRGASREPLT
jgi:2-polyprenyl-6-methoxyphenol hydroxylase-like FAD-dependent oxidoreductase